MLLTCPECSTSYQVADNAIPPKGRVVRCIACKHAWMQMPDGLTNRTLKSKLTSGKIKSNNDVGDDGKDLKRQVEPHARVRKKAHGRIELTRRLAAIVPWGLAASVALAAGFVAVHKRNDIVRSWPKSASVFAAIGKPANLYGLDITNVKAQTATDVKGRRVFVRGQIASVSSTDEAVPYLKVSLVDAKGIERVSWMVDPKIEVLKARQVHNFVTVHPNNLAGDLRALIVFAEPPLKIPRPPPEPPTGATGLMGAQLPKGLRARVEAPKLPDLPPAQQRPDTPAQDKPALTAR